MHDDNTASALADRFIKAGEDHIAYAQDAAFQANENEAAGLYRRPWSKEGILARGRELETSQASEDAAKVLEVVGGDLAAALTQAGEDEAAGSVLRALATREIAGGGTGCLRPRWAETKISIRAAVLRIEAAPPLAPAATATPPDPSCPLRLHVAKADLESSHGEPPRPRARVRVRIERGGRFETDRETSYQRWVEVADALDSGKGADFSADATGKRAGRLADMLDEWGLPFEREESRIYVRGVRLVRVDDWDKQRTLARVVEEGARREAGGRPRR